MSEVSQLLATLKLKLKQQGKTYREIAAVLEVSEASIKRLFRPGSTISVERLVQLSNLLGYTLAELAQEASVAESRVRTLSAGQEKELAADTKLLLVAVCALNHWSLADITAAYRLSEAECVKKLLRLDHLRLISLLPGNRIRLNIARDFDWMPEGPIRQVFQNEGLPDFLDSRFHAADESLAFANSMLTAVAAEKMRAELRLLRQKFADLHQESLSAPLEKRRGTGLLLALREWEPAAFAMLRRPRLAR